MKEYNDERWSIIFRPAVFSCHQSLLDLLVDTSLYDGDEPGLSSSRSLEERARSRHMPSIAPKIAESFLPRY
jgi:hypothetical protein